MEKEEILRLCVYPMELVWGNVEANLKRLDEALSKIKSGTEIVVLPETFSTGFPTKADPIRLKSLVENEAYQVFDCVKLLSHKYNVCIAGSCIACEDRKLYNRAFFVTPDGDISHAGKKHLFSLAGEDQLFNAGDKRLLVNYKDWKISMIVCYDIRFPVWCRNVDNQYDLLLAVANWPKVRVNVWEKLLQARAIENEAYVAGVNCNGIDDHGFEYNGSSLIVDFKGESIGRKDGEFIYADLSLDKLRKFRAKFPAWRDADAFTLK